MMLNEITTTTQVISDVVGEFLERQSYYAGRNYLLDVRNDMYEGRHWMSDPDEDTEFQLVLNYSRNVALRYAAILSRAPKPRVPIPATQDDEESLKANKREKLMMVVWPKIMNAWQDVEMNASKLSYGVFQAIWDPQPDEPTQVDNPDGTTQRVYTEQPFRFRSIPPKNFYPVYRTYDRPNDFLAVFRHDPGRVVADLEKQYGRTLLPLTDPEGNPVISASPICDVIEYWTDDDYQLIAMISVMISKQTASRRLETQADWHYETLQEGPNPYGTIPFWVLQNIRSDPNSDPTSLGSMSDLDDIQGLNKHLNLILSEEAEEIVINIHRPMIYKSDEHLQDPASLSFSPGAVHPIGEDEDLSTLLWQGEPQMVPTHVERLMKGLRDLSFLGDAGFGKTEAGVSGASMSVAMAPMQQIIELKLPLRIEILQDVCKFVLKCFEMKAEADAALRVWAADKFKQFGVASIRASDVSRQYFVGIDYGNLLPRDDIQHEQNEVYKFKTGVQSLFTTLDNLGYDDPQRELGRIRDEMQDPVLNPERVVAIAQAQQVAGQGQQQPPPQPPEATTPQQPQLPGMGGLEQLFGGGGGELPGTAVPGTAPVNEQTFGGLGGIPGQSPPVPNPQAFPRGPGQGGPGALAPFLNRREPNA